MLNIASFGILVYFSDKVVSLHSVIKGQFKVYLASPSHNFKRHFDEEIFDLEICIRDTGGGTLGQAFLTTFVKTQASRGKILPKINNLRQFLPENSTKR